MAPATWYTVTCSLTGSNVRITNTNNEIMNLAKIEVWTNSVIDLTSTSGTGGMNNDVCYNNVDSTTMQSAAEVHCSEQCTADLSKSCG